ncbi:tryptophanase [Vibrio ponticus]|nr:tryptophanase [Vibrio ponticus]
MTFPAEPFRIKAVETVAILDRTERERKLAEAGYNTFLLSSKDAYFDLLTDSGTSSISARQWANMMFRDHVDSSTDKTCPLEQTIRELYGFKHVIATQKSRSAESLLSMLTIEHGQRVLGNTCSASHRFHIENQGGGFVDVIAGQAYQTELNIPFKGNIDLDKLAQQIEDHGADNIAYIRLSATVNSVGGKLYR